MNKIIALIVFISISVLAAGCGNKQVKIQPKSNNQSNIIDSANNSINQKQETNNATIPSPTASKIELNYSNYSGNWVTESNLKDDFIYGIVVSISVDKDGNLKGGVGDSTENVTHVSNVDIKGKIQDNKFIYNFDSDSWGHSGTIKLDFKENKIVLTINYNQNSSKDNLWGIGEGVFTLINSNTKVDRNLTNLKDGGLQVIENQCFSVNLENYGSVKFISGSKREDANTIAVFYLANSKNNILYKFAGFYGNQKGMLNSIRAISFVDVNKDGLKDIVIIGEYKNHISGTSSTPINVCSIYFQKGKEFLNDKGFDDRVNNSLNNKDITSVLKYAKDNLNK